MSTHNFSYYNRCISCMLSATGDPARKAVRKRKTDERNFTYMGRKIAKNRYVTEF